MSYLCLKASGENTISKSFVSDMASDETINNMLYVEASQLFSRSPSVLPTLTTYIVVGDQLIQARAFKDGGCQQTFICAALAESLNLPIVQHNLPLKMEDYA